MSITRIVENVVLPPEGLIWLALLGVGLLALKKKRWGRGCLAVSLSGLYLFSTPFMGEMLLKTLDRYPPLPPTGLLEDAQGIVVLGAGLRRGAREYGADTVSSLGLERLRYGARLAERTGRPVLVTGYSGVEMAEVLESSLRTAVSFLEEFGRTTQENAFLSARLLHPRGIRRIYLVTHYWHMPRSVAIFRRAGFEPVPAPLGFADRPESARGLFAFLPKAYPLVLSRQVFHEWGGRVWYGLRYGSPRGSGS